MSESRQPVIVGGARTPVGRLLGSLASKSASELGGVAIAGALQAAGIAPDQVQYVIMGQVLQAGAGQITARQAAVAAGISMSVPALTVNKVCLSGLDAIALASQLVRLGEYDVIVAGGMESMTQAPHLLKNSRAGYKFGPVQLEDSMALDGLTDPFDLFTEVRKYQVRDVADRITTPLLTTDPDNEQFFPGQPRQLYDLLPGEKEIIEFTQAQGANFHCQPTGRRLTHTQMLDWLADHLPSQQA